MTVIDLGNNYSVLLEKVVAFQLSGPQRPDRFLTIYLEGNHKVRTGDQDGIERFIKAMQG